MFRSMAIEFFLLFAQLLLVTSFIPNRFFAHAKLLSGSSSVDYTSLNSQLSTMNSPSSPSSSPKLQISNITFVSGNPLKKTEVKQILDGSIPCQLLFDTVEFDEPQATPLEISQAKCRQAVRIIKGPCLVEDTSLCFNALNGLPGPYIKWFIDSIGNEGLSRLLDGFEDKSAFAQCVVSFTLGEDQEVFTFVGQTNGHIVKPIGPLGFGWDSVFTVRINDANNNYFYSLLLFQFYSLVCLFGN